MHRDSIRWEFLDILESCFVVVDLHILHETMKVQSPGHQAARYISSLEMFHPNTEVAWWCTLEALDFAHLQPAIWVCLKMLCTPKPNGFADHYPY